MKNNDNDDDDLNNGDEIKKNKLQKRNKSIRESKANQLNCITNFNEII